MPLISVLFLTFASCGQKYFSSDGYVWGTTYHIVYEGMPELADSITVVTARIDSSLSLFNTKSELTAVNDGSRDEVSFDFVTVYGVARRVWELSGGVYDPTVAPLTRLWGFGPDEPDALPEDSAVCRALQTVGFGKSHLRGCVIERPSGMQFDFASVAKGYGVDCVADMLRRNGCRNYMIEIGGEIVAEGVNPKGEPWRIQIDSPDGGFSHNRMALCRLGPARTAMAGSGNYRNFRTDSAGHVFGHTISPLTGRPVQSSMVAVTIVAGECALADALATACMAASNTDSAMAFVRRADAEALLVYASGDSLVTVATSAFPFE